MGYMHLYYNLSLKVSRATMDYLHGLAGVDELFAKCTQFCFTALAHHAFSKRIRGGMCQSSGYHP